LLLTQTRRNLKPLREANQGPAASLRVRIRPPSNACRKQTHIARALTLGGSWNGETGPPGASGSTSPPKLQPLLELYFVACLMERTWRFCLPVVLAKTGPAGYKAVAVLCFASPLAVLLFAPFIGQMLDASRRSGLFVQVLLLAQVLSIVLSGVLLSCAFWSGLSIVDGWVFVSLLLLQMVEKLSAVTSEVAIERDWITRICGKDNTAGLAHGNSMIRRFDLACDFVGTVGVGVMIDRLGVGVAVWYCMLMSVLSWPVINSRLRLLDIDADIDAGTTRGAIANHSNHNKNERLTTVGNNESQERRRNTIYAYFFDNPMLFSSLVGTSLPSSLSLSASSCARLFLTHRPTDPPTHPLPAVVLMYFNVALSPGGILSAYLIHRDMSGTGLAVFRGACALMGFLGSLVGKALINARGLMSAGRISLTFVVATLGLSLLVRIDSVGLFAALIAASRIGIWAFDNVNAQLFQQGTSSSEQSGLAATEAALCSAAEIAMFGLVVGRGKEVAVEWFGWLGFLGWFMVVGGWIAFFWSSWSREEHDRLVV